MSLSTRIGSRAAAGAAALLLCALSGAGAQWTRREGVSATLATTPAPHYAGVPVTVQVTAEGFEEDPAPECTGPQPSGGVLAFLGTQPASVGKYIINGQAWSEISYRYVYRFTADTPGRYKVGPFTVTQGNRTATTRAITLDLKTIAVTDDMRIRVVLPEKPVYLGEHVPVAVEWWLKRASQEAILATQSWSFVIPVFDLGAAVDFKDPPHSVPDRTIQFDTAGGEVRLPYTTGERREDGKDYLVIRAERTLVPLKAGEYALPGAVVTADMATRWERGFFGRREPGAVKKIRAEDLPRKLVVRDVPREGRPGSFAGAVGRGFTLEAAADRTVVQVGDPIVLTLVLRGDGNIDRAGLPPLGDAGLSPSEFRLPSAEASGILAEDGSKTFQVTVRVQSDAVREIPAISYSWFDTERGAYDTTRSLPIALSVRRGEIVTARDAIGKIEPVPTPAAEGEEAASTAGVASGGAATARPVFTLTGADLSVTLGEAVLADERRRFGGRAAVVALYVAPLLALGLAVVRRRRADIDPRVLERRRRLAAGVRRIQAALDAPEWTALTEIAAALREMLQAAPEMRSPETDAFLAECEVVIFAPDRGGTTPLGVERRERAVAIARAIREAAR